MCFPLLNDITGSKVHRLESGSPLSSLYSFLFCQIQSFSRTLWSLLKKNTIFYTSNDKIIHFKRLENTNLTNIKPRWECNDGS